MIHRLDGFLSFHECQELCDFFERNKHLTNERDFSGFPILRHSLFDADARVIAQKAIRKLGMPNLYEETMLITGTGVGGWHSAHADNEKLENGSWQPNHTPHRVFSAIIYLNEEFVGGLLRFPEWDLTIKPYAGLMIGFPSDRHYVHEVTQVERGIRYSMPIWFTDLPAKQIRWLAI